MKSLLSILSALLEDASRSLGADTRRDRETILDRIEHEGVAFLHVTLPEFGSWLELSLDLGLSQPLVFNTFRRKPKSTGSVLPCFLQGLTRLVFNERTGIIRKDASEAAIFFIRQVCYLFKKPKALASPKRVAAAIRQYVETDKQVLDMHGLNLYLPIHRKGMGDISIRPQAYELENRALMNSFWIEAVSQVILPEFEANYLEAETLSVPKHGPGATADKLRGNAKFMCRGWYERWNGIFYHEELYGYTVEIGEDLDVISEEQELPVKVIPVPKTYKTSRIISIEPTAMQYAQQYILSKMVYSIENGLLNNVVKLTDQSQNRRLAREGSVSPMPFATIDLSEASDRVGNDLVQVLFERHCPTLNVQLQAARSSHARLPSGEILSLRKFASMGSATTFPVESVVFAILAIAGTAETLWESSEHPSNQRDWLRLRSYCIKHAATLVSVFGDDIIVPRTAFKVVCQYLEACGLKVNAKKSFAQGRFKESCGGDYYNGVDVTPVYCRTSAPGRPADAEALISFVSLSNQLYKKGCWRAAEATKSIVESIIGRLPLRTSEASYLGWETFVNAYEYERFNSNFSPVVRSYTVKSRKRSDPLDGNSALLKHFLSRMPQETEDHLEYSVERHSTRLRRGWLTA